MNRFALDVALAACLFGAVSIVLGGYNLLRMGKFIIPDIPRRRYYAFPFGDERFTDPEGKIYRDRCLRWFGAFVFCAFIFCALIMNTPNFEL